MEIHLSKWQTRVFDDPHRYKVINAGRRSGKSLLSVIAAISFAHSHPRSITWFISPTYKQSKAIAWELFREYLPHPLITKTNETDLTIHLENGSQILLKGADNPDSLRGVRIDFCIFDECAFIDKWGEVWKVVRPTLADSRADVWFISTPNGHNHFKALAEMKDKDWVYYHFTTYDNPHIRSEEIEAMKAEMSEDAFAQEVMGRFIKKSGLVYKEFDRHVHVKELKDFEPVYWIRGCDRGFRNPTAVPIIAVNKDDTWYQVDELYETNLTNPLVADILLKMDKSNEVKTYELSTMDSAQASDIQELNNLGFDFIPVRKESGEPNIEYVRWKIQKFTERLKVKDDGPGYYVHPKCLSTIAEFESYSWKEERESRPPEETPEKKNDHMMDALADLNAMYEHYYKEEVTHPWDNKIPGTYIRPSMPEEDDNVWT